MKTRFLIIILIGLSVIGIFGVLYIANMIKNIDDYQIQEDWMKNRAGIFNSLAKEKKCTEMGGAWNAQYCFVTQEIFENNKLKCDPGPVLENNVCTSSGVPLTIQSNTILSEGIDDFDKTWGGPGNRHPAFWGYDVPEICTEDMIKHLVKYSSMFERNMPYTLEWISLDDSVNVDDFDTCVDELLERNPKELENENEN